jgi:hypothetical protein
VRAVSGARRGFRRVFNFLGAVLTVVALLVILVRELQEYPLSAGWPVTSGEVTVSRMTGNSDNIGMDFEYEYRVGDTTYTGDRATFFEYVTMANLQQQRQFIADHPIGTTVSVHYNLANPARSVIMRTIPLSQAWSPALFLLCLVGVLVSSVVGLILRRLWREVTRRAEDLAERA